MLDRMLQQGTSKRREVSLCLLCAVASWLERVVAAKTDWLGLAQRKAIANGRPNRSRRYRHGLYKKWLRIIVVCRKNALVASDNFVTKSATGQLQSLGETGRMAGIGRTTDLRKTYVNIL